MALINKSPTCVECKFKHEIFYNLTEDELLIINENKLEVVYNEGEVIFKQGTPITHIVSVTKGLAKIYIEGVSKKNLILQYVRPTEFLGGPGAFTDKIHHYSVIAMEETTACLISVEIFKDLMHKNIEFAFGYIEDVSKKGIYNFNKFISLTQKQMHGRIAEALLYYKDTVYPDHSNGFPLYRKDIAELTALSKDSASRILNSLHESKIIEISESTIKILNRKQLEKISIKG
ncbi:MAG: Crp/Fnr family transcriptional regulator [Bacteroidales bacterium]|jgi:CRP/FNR family transcriptional regulator